MKENERLFCIYFESYLLPNKYNVSYDSIREAAKILGYPINGNCATCYSNYARDLYSKYRQLEPEYYKELEMDIDYCVDMNRIMKEMEEVSLESWKQDVEKKTKKKL